MENSYTYKMIMKDLYLSKNSPREVGGYIAGWYNECSEEERNELEHLFGNALNMGKYIQQLNLKCHYYMQKQRIRTI